MRVFEAGMGMDVPSSNPANADLLPGRWGLLQGILGVWAPDVLDSHPALRFARRCFDTAAVYRNWRRDRDPAWAKVGKDRIADWLAATDMKPVNVPPCVNHIARAYLSDLPCEHKQFLDEARRIAVYDVADVKVATVQYTTDDARSAWIKGPYTAPSAASAVMTALGDLVWQAERCSTLQLIYMRNNYGPDTFSLSPLPPSDVYVDATNGMAQLAATTRRCQAFLAAGYSRRVLFYGPPGTGKSSLARTLAEGIGEHRTLRVDPSMVEQMGGDTIVAILDFMCPTVLMLDDMDRTAGSTTALMHALERLDRRMIVVGTVNTLSTLDPALLRPGRFDQVMETKEPDEAWRDAIILHYCKRFGVSYDAGFVLSMDGFSPADIREVLLCISMVGTEYIPVEIDRVRLQRGLFSGNKCGDYLTRTADDRPKPCR